MDRIILENIFVTALEGGSNHWCLLHGSQVREVRKVVPKEVDPCLSTALFAAVYDHGLSVTIHDAENPSEVVGILSRDTFEERLSKLREDGSLKWALHAEEDESGDAETSDVVFQYLVMGQYIYA